MGDEAVRTPIRARKRGRRTLDQRVMLRFPRLARASFHAVMRLRPSSRLRRAALSRALRLGAEAYNRRDLDAVTLTYHPAIEYRPAKAWVEAGFFEPCYHGTDGYKRYVATTAEVFGGEVYFMPFEVIDLGDRLAVLATVPMRAQASGIPLTESFAYVATLRNGMVDSMQEYYDHAEALAAARVPTG